MPTLQKVLMTDFKSFLNGASSKNSSVSIHFSSNVWKVGNTGGRHLLAGVKKKPSVVYLVL